MEKLRKATLKKTEKLRAWRLDKEAAERGEEAKNKKACAEKEREKETALLIAKEELLDNNQRAETAGKWFLKPFLVNLL